MLKVTAPEVWSWDTSLYSPSLQYKWPLHKAKLYGSYASTWLNVCPEYWINTFFYYFFEWKNGLEAERRPLCVPRWRLKFHPLSSPCCSWDKLGLSATEISLKWPNDFMTPGVVRHTLNTHCEKKPASASFYTGVVSAQFRVKTLTETYKGVL